MLRRCCSTSDDDADGVDVKLNCIINSACCAEGRIKDIEVVEASAVAQDVTDGNSNDGGDELVDKERGEKAEEYLLQPPSSGRSSISEGIGDGCKAANGQSEGLVDEAGDLHASS